MEGFPRFPEIPLFRKSGPGTQDLAPRVRIRAQTSDSGLGPGGPPHPYLPLRFTKIVEFPKIGSAIADPNGWISEISRNSTFPEIRARASGSGPTRQDPSPDVRFWARAGRAAISIPTPSFYENHGIPENRVGYLEMEGFPRFPEIPLFQKSEPGPQDLAPRIRI